MYKLGKRSQERLRGVNSQLVNILFELVKIMDITVLEGVRTQERQDKLVAEGKSKTKFSKHITGRAVDIAPYTTSFNHPIDWEDRDRFHYMGGMLRGIAKQMGVDVRWGGDWDSDGETKDNNFDDLVHIELK